MNQTPASKGKKPRGRPPKYASEAERQAARRTQVRDATRVWRDNRRAGARVLQQSVHDAGSIIDRVINNVLALSARVAQHPERYPQGFAELLQVYADDARAAALHLRYVREKADTPRRQG